MVRILAAAAGGGIGTEGRGALVILRDWVSAGSFGFGPCGTGPIYRRFEEGVVSSFNEVRSGWA